MVEAKVEVATDNTTKPPIHTTHYAPELVAPILIIVCAIGIVLFISNVWKLPQKRKVTIYRFKSVNCMNCRYFNDSHYLKCAVHPSTVLTKKALNCSDYCSKSSITQPESTDDYFG